MNKQQAAELRALIEDYSEAFADLKVKEAKFPWQKKDDVEAARAKLDAKIDELTAA